MRIGAFLRRVNAKIANFFSKATSKGVPKRSLCISLVVGSLLTLINQGEQKEQDDLEFASRVITVELSVLLCSLVLAELGCTFSCL